MFRYLPALLLAGFILEISSIIWAGRLLGVFPTVLLLIAGGMAGVSLFKSAGSNAAAAVRSSFQDRRSDERLASATMARVIAGLLFIVPGFISDIGALILLLPPVHGWIGSRISLRSAFRSEGFSGGRGGRTRIIDGEAVEINGEIGETGDREEDRRPF